MIRKHKKVTAISLVGLLFLALFSVNANAFTVWAVNAGDDSTFNNAGNALVASSGVNAIDLYFDTEGDISWNWDISLEVTGTGNVSGVQGGDINGGFGIQLTNGGWQQLGGNVAVSLNSPSVKMFSFVFDADPGAVLSIGAGSNYTSGTTFGSELITAGDLVTVSAVPLPAAIWLFIGGAGFIGFASKRNKASAK